VVLFVCGEELRRWREPSHRNTAHNCDALPSKCTARSISGWDGDQAKQTDWIYSSYRRTRYSRSGRRSAGQCCACQRLSCRAQFARAGGQVVVLPIRLAHSTQMLRFGSILRSEEVDRRERKSLARLWIELVVGLGPKINQTRPGRMAAWTSSRRRRCWRHRPLRLGGWLHERCGGCGPQADESQGHPDQRRARSQRVGERLAPRLLLLLLCNSRKRNHHLIK
jgi:hypothetical protein